MYILNELTGAVEGGFVAIPVTSSIIYEPTGKLKAVKGLVKLIKYPPASSETKTHAVVEVVFELIPFLQLVVRDAVLRIIGFGINN